MNRRSFLSLMGLAPVAAATLAADRAAPVDPSNGFMTRSEAIEAFGENPIEVSRHVVSDCRFIWSCRWGVDENGKSYLIESQGGEP